MATGGRNMGRVGVITHRERHDGGFNIVHIKDVIDNSFATRESNVFVIGKEKPWISLPKGKGVKVRLCYLLLQKHPFTFPRKIILLLICALFFFTTAFDCGRERSSSCKRNRWKLNTRSLLKSMSCFARSDTSINMYFHLYPLRKSQVPTIGCLPNRLSQALPQSLATLASLLQFTSRYEE